MLRIIDIGQLKTGPMSKVLFSHESSIQQFVVCKYNVCRPVGKRCGPKYTLATMKHPPAKRFGRPCQAKALRDYIFDPWNHNEWKKYLNFLEDKLKLHMNIHESKIFMHDSAPCHEAKVMTSYLKNETAENLPWHGNIPDLNPTENL